MFAVLFLLWLLFNGRITLEIILFGLFVSAACYAASCVLFGFSVKKDLALTRKAGGIVKLLFLLLCEIIKANLLTIRMIYGRKQPNSCFVSFPAPVSSSAGKAGLANCITLTPGTITADVEDNVFSVHCLDESMGTGLDDSSLVRQLQSLEGGKEAE